MRRYVLGYVVRAIIDWNHSRVDGIPDCTTSEFVCFGTVGNKIEHMLLQKRVSIRLVLQRKSGRNRRRRNAVPIRGEFCLFLESLDPNG